MIARLIVDTVPAADVTIVTAAGEVDHATAADLHDVLASVCDEGRGVVVDLSQVTFMSSAGLQALILARERLTTTAVLAVVAGMPATWRVLELTGVVQLLPTFRELTAAVQAAGRPPAGD